MLEHSPSCDQVVGCHLITDGEGSRGVRFTSPLHPRPAYCVPFGDFGDFGVSDAATVAWRYTRRGGPRLSIQGEPLVVLTLVTLVSQMQPLWRGVTQGGVAPVFPFRANPSCADARTMRYHLCNAAPQ